LKTLGTAKFAALCDRVRTSLGAEPERLNL
jgi:hypothetical protein